MPGSSGHKKTRQSVHTKKAEAWQVYYLYNNLIDSYLQAKKHYISTRKYLFQRFVQNINLCLPLFRREGRFRPAGLGRTMCVAYEASTKL